MRFSIFALAPLAMAFIKVVVAQDGVTCSSHGEGVGSYGCGARPGQNAYVWVCGADYKGHLVAYCACPTCCHIQAGTAFCG
ncbi:hypothetical protein CPB83DRAFT_852341 [Crepidotus variabilis]|uniref:Uncharacterized protein n=1 Tax=Crepidotus variabilis TaxID=179855 RepID=A0A9P6JQU1_9AGAR|nr:hypothetical protein CPB83DRAFT_852341 [Crepidotus variabilis]